MMIATLKKLWPFGSCVPGSSSHDGDASPSLRALVSELHYEIVPMKSIDQAIEALPAGANVSVTCSPVKGIPATQELTERLVAAGFHTVPHLSARMVDSKQHAADIAGWIRELGLEGIYVIAGDPPDPHGPYEGALELMRDLLEADTGVARVGFAGYPDGHAFIPRDVVDEQLHAKQALLDEFGVGGWVSTQMCFDAATIRAWLEAERARGLTVPVRLGVPGVVDRTRLMRMGTRLGIGTSLRYLSKNRSSVMRLLAPGGYDPTDLVAELADDADRLGIETVHSFTFNSVADTRAWQEAITA